MSSRLLDALRSNRVLLMEGAMYTELARAGLGLVPGLPVWAGRLRSPRYHARVAHEQQQPLAEQLKEIGARLDWVRDYL